jgi:hypothetical protein
VLYEHVHGQSPSHHFEILLGHSWEEVCNGDTNVHFWAHYAGRTQPTGEGGDPHESLPSQKVEEGAEMKRWKLEGSYAGEEADESDGVS